METSREDFGIVVRSAFLKRGVQQRFSLFALIVFSVVLLFVEKIETKPLDYLRFFIKDIVYRSSVVISFPSKGLDSITSAVGRHIDLYDENIKLREENTQLKTNIFDPTFLIFENKQLRKLLEEDMSTSSNLVSSRVMLDKQSPYLNSFIINGGINRKIKKGMAVLDEKNFIGRIVDVNFFSSRVLLVTDLNSKISVLIEPLGYHAILSGHGTNEPILEYLPKKHKVQPGNKIYTSGKEGIFSPGIPIGKVRMVDEKIFVSLFSDISQITFVNINLKDKKD